MSLPPIGVSMVGSIIGVLFGLTASGLFLFGDVNSSSSIPAVDMLTTRIGAICSLLIAGGGVITAVGGQILGAYKLYIQQREVDTRQGIRHADLVGRLESSIAVSKALETELLQHRRMATDTIKDMESQIESIQGMLDVLTKDLKQTVIDQAKGTMNEIKDVITKKEGNGGHP